jgi:RNA polymerase sigma-70 factor (ECF subfamily)
MGRGDSSAFEELFTRYYAQVYRVAYGVVGTGEAAEDLAQETFLELYQNAPTLAFGVSLVSWLCRVALNKGYNSLRGERRALQRMERFAYPGQDDPYADLLRVEERTRVREVLEKLPERQSKLLMLRYAGLSLAEIATALGVAPGSVGTLLARAERAFAAAYESMHPAERDSLEKRTQ